MLFAFCVAVKAQSTNQDFPTPVTGSEISGKIPARDVGDPRLTNYFYVFNGTQGDVFINVTATNLNGDIDVFTIGSLRPLTKISLYAGDSATETGRVIYLRKPEKLILRIEGRTPNDNPAAYRIKFAGSFVPLQAGAETEEPKLPEIKSDENNSVRVNSVGTIIEIKPKPTPQPRETTAKVERENKPEVEIKEEEKKGNEEAKEEEKPAKVVAADETPKAGEETPVKRTAPRRRRTPPASGASRTKTPANATETPPKNTAPKKETPKETAPNPLAGVRLIVSFKDGTTLERPMSEVSRVNVDNKGMLTIVLKDGKIERHSILDVAKMTIE
ncbi:MAG TPA: hypothetical protein VGB00_16115 [Pyrinomonadaceae bacterium]